jgi:hypothetical protein
MAMTNDEIFAAADTARIQGGGKSILDKVGEAATAGTAGAVTSALAGFYNTGVSVANFFGAQAKEMDTARVLGDINKNWQTYYETNKDVLDTVGFIGGSFIPGSIALKGLQAAKAGKALGTFGTVLRYSKDAEMAYLAKGLQEVALSGGTIYSRINTAKLAGMMWGAADSVLDNAVFSVATIATMHASPLLANESWGDIAWDTAKWSLFGGAATGLFHILPINRMYKDAGKLVDGVQRKYDVINRSENLAADVGDKTFDLINQVLALPLKVLEEDRALAFNMKVGGTTKAITLDTGAMLDRTLQATTDKALNTIQAGITNLVKADTSVGASLAQSIVKTVKAGMVEGADLPAIRKTLMDKLMGLQEIESLGAAPKHFSSEVFYLSPGATLKQTEKITAKFAPKKLTPEDVGYRLVGDINDAAATVIGTEYSTVHAAFEAGKDIAIHKDTGLISINPNSSIFSRITQGADEKLRSVYNVRTNTITDNAMPTIADIATATNPLRVTGTGVSAGSRTLSMALHNYNPAADSIETTARMLWADTFNAERQISNAIISHHDFAVLSKMAAEPAVIGKNVRIQLADGTLVPTAEIGPIGSWLANKKVEYANTVYNTIKEAEFALKEAERKGEPVTKQMRKAAYAMDPREMGYRINMDVEALEKLISNDFNPSKLTAEEFNRPLKTYEMRDQIVMVYDNAIREAMKDGDFVSTQQNHYYRMMIAKQKQMEASTYVLGKDAELFVDINEAEAIQQATATGAGATVAGASNANYGELLNLWAQDSGKNSAKAMARRADDALSLLQPAAIDLLADKLAGAELAAVLTRVRRSKIPLSLLGDRLVDLAAKEQYNAILVRKGNLEDVTFAVNIKLDPKVSRFLRQHHEGLHGPQFDQMTALMNAQGVTHTWNRDALYVPPVDTRKIPYFAFVRPLEGRPFNNSTVGMITARSPEELDTLISGISPEFQVIRKGNNELYHKALGDYEQARTLNNMSTDPFEGKAGKLGDFLPTLEPKAAIEDFVNYHVRKEQQLVRDAVEVRYGETFNKLRWLSEENTASQRSKFEYIGTQGAKTITDPYGDYLKTALNISKKAEYTLWHQANEFVDALGTRAYRAIEVAFNQAREGKITWEEGNAIMQKLGMDGPFTAENFAASQVGRDRQIIARGVRMGNMVLSVAGLGLDAANSLINIISSPILLGTELSSIKAAIGRNDPLAGKLAELLNVVDPATKIPVPSTTKLLGKAISNYWAAGNETLLERYKQIGAVSTILDQHKSMIADLTITPTLSGTAWAKKVDAAVETGTKLSGNRFAEQFTRFVSANVMHQLTEPLVEAGKLSIKEQNAYISIFVNRVQGNYTASQRPIIFQGTIGAALGLFQTYQFNLFQQLFRHIENRDLRTVAVLSGLQSAIFGLNGLPLFNAINTHLIGQANINEGHEDAYTFAVKAGETALGPKAGSAAADWLMYGTASAFPIFSNQAPALYTRGDINPRHITIIPTTPFQVPIYEVGSRVIGNLANMAKQIGNGGDVLPALLQGLEHNGISRPLAGVAQVMQGFSTTSQGSLISASSDFSSVATMSRIFGARPMDEALLLETKFRLDAYRAADKARIEDLGVAVKQKIRSNTLTTEDLQDFQTRYAEVGGRIENFGAAMQRWTLNANQSIINTMADHANSSYGRHLAVIMGDNRLQDMEQAPPESPR